MNTVEQINHVEFEGKVGCVTFSNEETGYAVMKLRVDPKKYRNNPCVSRQNLVTLCGSLARVSVGERIKVAGKLTQHPKYGPQVEVQAVELVEPKSQTEKIEYLAKNVFRIGPTLAKKIVEHFGDNVFEILDKDPDRLDEISGIGKKRCDEVKKIWLQQQEYRNLLVFCSKIGLSTTFIERIAKKYQYTGKAIDIIKSDPYRLARDIDGIGFARADEVAKHLGMHELSEVRIRAAAEHILHQSLQEGHCYLYATELIQKTVEFMANPDINLTVVGSILQRAIETKILTYEEPNRIYLPGMSKAENYVARRLRSLLSHPMPVCCQGDNNLQAILKAAADSATVPLDRIQCEAIWRTLTSKVSVITGGPGTGKTTITKAVVAGFKTTGLPIILLAPTGSAAKRMINVIGAEAYTIHRHLFRLQKAVKEGGLDIKAVQMHGVVIVDEVSMMDVKLSSWLLEYLADDALLVIIGDKDQLPSVGAGAVLRDLLRCEVIPKTMLKEIHRQARGSKIIVNSHKINDGVMPMWDYLTRNGGYPQSDMWLAPIDDAEEQSQCAIWAATTLSKQMGFDPTKDCMVLAPMKNGASGVFNLNSMMQRALNPNPSKSVQRTGAVWGVGDKVMQLRNNYTLGVVNGDLGVIVDITTEDNVLRGLKVDFDGDVIEYRTAEDWCDLALSYASTIHKVQGAEFPMVIICLHSSHWMLLQRNLLYTAVTRGKKFVLLIAHGSALSRAIGNNEVSRRNTFLAEKVMQEMN